MVYNNSRNNEAEQSPFSPYCYRHDKVNRFHVRVILSCGEGSLCDFLFIMEVLNY